MSKFTFICEEEPCPFGESITTKRTVEFNAVHLDGIIGEFETFLRGCGFNLKGHLEIAETYAKETFPLNHKDEEDDLDDLDSIFNGKSLIRSDEC
jgi:hypothetical protein